MADIAKTSLYDIFMEGAAPAMPPTSVEETNPTPTCPEKKEQDMVAAAAAPRTKDQDVPLTEKAEQEVPTTKKDEGESEDKKVEDDDQQRKRPAVAVASEDDDDVPDRAPEKKKQKKQKQKRTIVASSSKKAAAPRDKDATSFKKGGAAEVRHSPGYSMLKVERDKIERSMQTLMRKNETRIEQGKPTPTVCSILNDRLVEFYGEMADHFDRCFGKYIQN